MSERCGVSEHGDYEALLDETEERALAAEEEVRRLREAIEDMQCSKHRGRWLEPTQPCDTESPMATTCLIARAALAGKPS